MGEVRLCSLANWAVCSDFADRSSIVMLTIEMTMRLGPIPATEAVEQTVLQLSTPLVISGIPWNGMYI